MNNTNSCNAKNMDNTKSRTAYNDKMTSCSFIGNICSTISHGTMSMFSWTHYFTPKRKKYTTSGTITLQFPLMLLLLFGSYVGVLGDYDVCFDEDLKVYMACSPAMYDIIADTFVQVTVDPSDSTCGTPASTYRRLGDRTEIRYTCDASNSDFSHPPTLMIDTNSTSWWQSVSPATQSEDLPITIQLAFGKMFRLGGAVVLTFNYARPERMVLEKSEDFGQTWTPLQYFARFCENFRTELDPATEFTEADPMAVTCTNRYAESSNRIRSGRRLIYDLDSRLALFWGDSGSDLVSLYSNLQTKMLNDLMLTNLRIRLIRPYTDGSADVDKFFYAIQDMNVMARCFCNLHAQSCSNSNNVISCRCAHNTDGTNCERCMPLYNERQWQRGSYIPYPSGTANECIKCECNEHALACTFNATYGRGICNDCLHNTEGNHCQNCQSGFYPNVSRNISDVDRCVGCNCNPIGSNNTVCNRDLTSNTPPGQCVCKTLVTGLDCDRCVASYYGLILGPVPGECQACECDLDGTTGRSNTCAQEDGQCPCKTSTAGRQCNICADTFFAFPTGNPDGQCRACGCNPGGSTSLVCNKETGICQCLPGIIGDKCEGTGSGSFVPLIDTLVYQPESGSCQLTSDLWTPAEPFDGSGFAICDLSSNAATVAFEDIPGGMVQVALSWPYFVALRYTNPSSNTFSGTLTLTVTGDATQSLSPLSLRLGQPIPQGCPLENGDGGEVSFTFPPGRSTAALSSDITFENDARCKYSLQLRLNPVQETARKKRAVTIPDNGILIDSVVVFPSLSSTDNSVRLAVLANSNDEAATRQTHATCIRRIADLSIRDQALSSALCHDLLFTVSSDIYKAVVECGCSEVGANNPTQCTALGGQCDCKSGVGGRICDVCLPGFFNMTEAGCQACNCYTSGSETGHCDVTTGQCQCKVNVLTLNTLPADATSQARTAARTCAQCQFSFYGLDSGNGCSACQCISDGSTSLQCDDNGQCPCKETVQGLKCDVCKDAFFNFGPTGCSACQCSEEGSTTANCHQTTGLCTCKRNAIGDKCDGCTDGHFNLASYNPDGCQQCFCFEHATSCTSDTTFELGMIEVTDSSDLDSLNGERHTSYGRSLTFSLAADFILDISGETLVTIEDTNGNVIFHQARENSMIQRNELLQYQVGLFEQNWLLQSESEPVQPTPLQMYRTLAAISKFTFIVNSKGQQIRVSGISLEIPVLNATTTEPVSFVESCTCQPNDNVQGLSCESCAGGFKRPDAASASSYQACVACDCNNRGATSPPECEEITGICLNCRNGTMGDNCENCSPFVTGADCDTCQANYWGLGENGCKACSCSSPGSTSTVCNQETGQCDCASNVVGRTCDTCDENFYQLTATGCIECDACYSLLQDGITELRTLRDYLAANVTNVEEQDATVGDLEPFVARFQAANEDTAKLISFLDSAARSEVEVQSNITSLRSSLEAIQPHLTVMENTTLIEIEDDLTNAEVSIADAEDQRQKLVASASTAHFKLVALEASSTTLNSLADDLKRVETFLQTLAEASASDTELLNELNHLETTSHTANNLASGLLTRVQEANRIQQNNTGKLLRLESQTITLMTKVTETLTSARSILASSQDTSKSASRLQSSLAEIQAFVIDFPSLKTRTATALSATNSIEARVMSENTDLTTENVNYQATTETVQDITASANTVGNTAAQLLTRANRAEQRLLIIQQNVNTIFDSAESAREILNDFNTRAVAIEARAQTALDQVATVHNLSLQLINESQALSQALTSLQQIATRAQQASEQALQAVQPKLTQIQGASIAATELNDRLDNTNAGYEERETAINYRQTDILNPANATCQTVQTNIADFRSNLSEADTSASTALVTAGNVSTRANSILTELRGLQRVDGAAAQRLLDDIRAVELNLNADDVRNLVEQLMDANTSQQEQLNQLTVQRNEMEMKVERLRNTLQQIRPIDNNN